MGSFFRAANREEVVRYTTPDGEDWIEFRAELTKAEVNAILAHIPQGERDLAGGLAFLETFFGAAVVRWSADVPPTVDAYREMPAVNAKWVDEQISTHMGVVMGREVDEMEGKPSS